MNVLVRVNYHDCALMKKCNHMSRTIPSGLCVQTILRCVAVSLLLPLGMGCDSRPQRVPIAGKVLIDGQPLTYGSVRFIPDAARPSMASLDGDGNFTLSCFDANDGAVRGTHSVEIVAAERLSATKVHWHAPKMYSDIRTSGLKYTVANEDRAVAINLTWNGGRPFDEIEHLENEGGPRSRQ